MQTPCQDHGDLTQFDAMKLKFLGTRGEIEARTELHRQHTATEVSYRGRRVLLDAGLDWLEELEVLAPRAIVLTHAHPDHAWGLKAGVSCPVWATATTWSSMEGWPLPDAHVVEPRQPFQVQGITFEAFPVEHSIRCPAVGYRITAGRVAVFYAPDLVHIPEREAALKGCALYVGDGATLVRSMVRKRGNQLIGHAPVRTQLGWCAKEGVPRMIVTHCGSEIVTADEAQVAARLSQLAEERGVHAQVAHDGMEVELR
jgi:phosphoribosyl 1,2-cyclic phosphodiesterase